MAVVGAAHMRVRVCDCAFRRVYSLSASLRQLCAVLMEMSPTAVAAETQRRYHRTVVPRTQKGGKTQSGQPANVSHALSPMSTWGGGGCGGEPVEWTLFWSFVYVRSGSRVLGERRSLGMLGLLACTVQ